MMPFDMMTTRDAIVTGAFMNVMGVITLAIAVAEYVDRRKRGEAEPRSSHGVGPAITITIASIALIATAIGLVPLATWNDATSHGAYDDTMPFKELAEHTPLTHEEDVLEDDLDGLILLFYRYGCHDCENVSAELEAWAEGRDYVRWVSTRSEQGSPLVQEFVIGEVPSAVYVANRAEGKFLYKATSAKGRLDTDALDSLVRMREADMARTDD